MTEEQGSQCGSGDRVEVRMLADEVREVMGGSKATFIVRPGKTLAV